MLSVKVLKLMGYNFNMLNTKHLRLFLDLCFEATVREHGRFFNVGMMACSHGM